MLADRRKWYTVHGTVRRLVKEVENRYPIYIISKGRWWLDGAINELHHIGAKGIRVVVEREERDEYARSFPFAQIITIPQSYHDDYNTLDALGQSIPQGSGPARNVALDHSRSENAKRHWVIDDNVYGWCAVREWKRKRVTDTSCLSILEQLCDRYSNVGLAAHKYHYFPNMTTKRYVFSPNGPVMSSILVNNSIRQRWIGRYNEDVILTTEALKARWCTIVLYAVLSVKMKRSSVNKADAGGNSELYGGLKDNTVMGSLSEEEMRYADEKGAMEKSRMLVSRYPDLYEMKWRYNRWHHVARRAAMLKLRKQNVLIPI